MYFLNHKTANIGNIKKLNDSKKGHKHIMRRKRRKKKLLHKSVPIVSLILLTILFSTFKNSIQEANIEIPNSILEFVEKYPEAQPFADNYAKYHDADCKIDIKKDIKRSSIPLFIQWDKRWGYKSYGSNMIGIAGCGPTCLSMVLSGLTEDPSYTPSYLAEYSSNNDYYISGQGTSWNLMSQGAKDLGLEYSVGEISESYIRNNLSAETPMICSMKPGDFTYTGHFIVLSGIDSDGLVIVNDPNSPSNSQKHWDASTLVPQIKGIWTYHTIG